MTPSCPVIGLTGGIACGKSTVAAILAELGAVVIDADDISREAVAPGMPALEIISSRFGPEALTPDGYLDRAAVRRRIFSSPEERSTLEKILHPEIRRISLERIAEARVGGARLVVYVAPLLVEAGAVDRVDEVWVVTMSPDMQLERLMTRDRIGMEEARRILSAQMPLAQKERYGNRIIDNSGTRKDLDQKVREIWRDIFPSGQQ